MSSLPLVMVVIDRLPTGKLLKPCKPLEPSFAIFPKLSPELQLKVWKYALPGKA
jgi:hypothetical protein